jgi:hypothetical protein
MTPTDNEDPILDPTLLIAVPAEAERLYIDRTGRAHDVGALEPPVLRAEVQGAIALAEIERRRIFERLYHVSPHSEQLGRCPLCRTVPVPGDGHHLVRWPTSGRPELRCPSWVGGLKVGAFEALGITFTAPPGVLRLPSPAPWEPVPQPAGEAPELIEGARTVDIVITVDDHEPPAPGLTYTPIDPATVAPVAGRLTPDMSPAAHPALAAVPGPPADPTGPEGAS